MTEKEWKHLKSGTDVRGVAVECDEKLELTDDVVKQIVFAFVTWIRKKENKQNIKMAIGHDSRISAERIKNAAIEVFENEGVEIYDCGLASTPSMFMTIVMGLNCDASLELTASHHPYHRNGLKFFTRNGGLEGAELEEILSIAMKEEYRHNKSVTKAVKYDYMKTYCEHLRNLIIDGVNAGEKPLDGLKIIVDAGNGVGGFYANEVLAPLGADISGSQFLEPDGMFPNHIPNPENKEAMESACKATVKANADLGIIFDTDVDRMGCVDSHGKEINRNRLVALASVIALDNNAGGTVVTDSLTSDGLRKFIEKDLGGKQLRFKRGYKNVIDKSIELNDDGVLSPLAIETSGHAALKENYFLDDGAYLATKIVVKVAQLKKEGKTIDDLISSLEEPAESLEIRVPIMLEDFREYGENVIAKLNEYAENRNGWEIEKENYEGTRINMDGGWFLLRLSVHDPILPLNIENNKDGVCGAVADELKKFLSQFDKLDLKNFD